MASTDFDVQIGSTKAKVLRAEDGGYRKRTIRREVEQQLLSQSESPSLVSRSDQRQLYQTSWAGGSRWWKPLMGPQEANTYFQSNHFDLWSEPGKVVPMNQVSDTADTNLNSFARTFSVSGDIYAIGSTNNEDATGLDIYKWTPASDAFVRVSGPHTVTGNSPRDLTVLPSNNDVYYLHGGGVTVFNVGTGTENTRISGQSVTTGASIFVFHGAIFFYDGNKIYQDVSGTATQRADDGLGRDFLQNVSGTNSITYHANINLATVSSSGVYYVKNIFQGDQPIATVFRLNRDAAGNYIVNPIAVLPNGHVALSITEHLGSIVVSATPNWRGMLLNSATNYVEVVLFSINNQSGISALGSVLGNREELDETPFKLLQSVGSLLYIGGHKRLWVYDAARGGIHTVHEWGTKATTNPYVSMAVVENSSGEHLGLFLTDQRYALQKLPQFKDPDTVTNFGDDETHYQLTSNYFDGGLPLETKELTKVAILREAGDGDQEWTVQIAADGGSFSDALTDSSTNQYTEADLSGTTGRRFQYRLIYQTKDNKRTPLEALLVTFTTGEMITEWDLTLDGSELLNIDNEVQNEEAFYDAMVTLADTATITTFVDNMQEQGQETDTGTNTNVKVQAVEIIKEKAGESMVRVVLREAA